MADMTRDSPLGGSGDARPWRLVRSFAGTFSAALVLLLGIAALHYYAEYRTERAAREAREAGAVDLGRRALAADIGAIVTDLLVLTRHVEELGLEATVGAPATSAGQIFRVFAEQKRFYDQIRFIDDRGRETLRINFDGERAHAVETEELQDKSERYYFRDAMSIRQGQIYVSPLDLNIERGQIEQPLKPVMRFAAPVFGPDGQQRGLVVLNYLGQRLLDNFRQATAEITDHVHLLEPHGYWLSSPDPAEAWGFMFGEERTFPRRWPAEWSAVLAEQAGQLVGNDGLLTFSSFSPAAVAAVAARGATEGAMPVVVTVGGADYFWKIVSRLPYRELATSPRQFLQHNGALYAAMIGLLALGALLLSHSRLSHRDAEMQADYERRFRGVLEGIELAAVSLDREGRVNFCNPFFAQLSGWSTAEIIGSSWLERFTPQEERTEMARVLALLATPRGFPLTYTCPVLTRSGEHRLFSWHNSLTFDSNGVLSGVSALGEDITEKRQYEEQLRKLNRAVEQSPSVVVITDRAGDIEYVNPKFCEITGYTAEEVIGKNPRILKSGETSAEDYAALWQAITRGSEWRGEFHNRKKSGEAYWESASISALRDSAGTITHFLAVKEDITERKRLEREVEARTMELARARALAEMGRVATMIAHDLRNPLSSIKVALKVLDRPEVVHPAETKELLGIALDQMEYMEAILTDMLVFARPETPRAEWISPQRLVESVLGTVQGKLDQYQVKVQVDCSAALPTFLGDPNQLRQVFANLLVNAAQATEQRPVGERSVSWQVGVELGPEGTLIRFDICDNGCGMSGLDAERLFEPFFTTRARGTGLGLAIVRKILDQHGGAIDLGANEPEGICATVLLPTVPKVSRETA